MTITTVKIDYSRDALFTEQALAILRDRYLLPTESSPQDMFARVATTYASDASHAQRLYDYASLHWLGFSTPLLTNGGTSRGLPISCFGGYVDDSRASICSHYTENAWLSSMGGGIGGYWGKVRSNEEATSKGGKSSGVIPFIKVVDSLMLAFSQGDSRRGSYAAYMDVSHPEIEEFIDIRRPTGGDPNRKAINLNNAVCIPDSFMKAVADGTMWELIDPNSKRVHKTIDARTLWMKILSTRVETGEPYILWTDTANADLTVDDPDLLIHQSNLCVAPETRMLVRSKTKYNVVAWESIKSLYGKGDIEVWNGDEWSTTKVIKTNDSAPLLRISFSNGATLECTPYHKFYIQNNYYRKAEEVKAADLVVGDKLEKWNLPRQLGRSSIRFHITVTKIEDTGRVDETYCVNEPIQHKVMFNGIRTGNCSEICIPTNEDRTFVCCLSSVNLEYFNEWKDHHYFIGDVVEMLDNVLTSFIETAPKSMSKAVYSATMSRAIGIGAMGFHTFLQNNGIDFDSVMAKVWNKKMFSHIWDRAVQRTIYLGEERGPAPDVQKSLGWRNSQLIAIAPTANNSIVCNTSPCIEPIAANIFTHKTLTGSFFVKNKTLERLLNNKYPSKNTDGTWADIASHDGSVQHLDWLEERSVFKTARELDQRWIIEHALDRQPYIDQAQSVNLFLTNNVDAKELHDLHWKAWNNGTGLKTLYYIRSSAARGTEKVSTKVERDKIINDSGECLACHS